MECVEEYYKKYENVLQQFIIDSSVRVAMSKVTTFEWYLFFLLLFSFSFVARVGKSTKMTQYWR